MRAGDVDVDDLQALLSELSEVGGLVNDTYDGRPFSRRSRGTVGGPSTFSNLVRTGNPGLKPHQEKSSNTTTSTPSPAAFSTYTTAGVSDTAMAQRNFITPLNIRLAPLSSKNEEEQVASLNPLPALSAGGLALPANTPVVPELPKPRRSSTPEQLPSAPAAGHRPTPSQAAMVTRHAPQAVVRDEGQPRTTNFLPVMCSRYLQPAGLTPTARWGHTLTPVSSSLLLMLGGMEVEEKASLGQFMAFNTHDIAWEPVAVSHGTTPSARHSHSACAYEEHSLVVYGGASTEDSSLIYGGVHLFDIHTHSWKCLWEPGSDLKKNEPAPRYGHSMVLHKNRLYVFGGRVKKNNSTTIASSDIYVFSLTCKRWRRRIRTDSGAKDAKPSHDGNVKPAPPPPDQKKGKAAPRRVSDSAAAVPAPRAFHAACVKGCVMFINGGSTGSGTLSDTWSLDLAHPESRWVQLHSGSTPDASPRERHHLFVCGEALLAVGGCGGSAATVKDPLGNKLNHFTAVLPVPSLTTVSSSDAPPNSQSMWIPVAMGNHTIVAPNRRSFGAALTSGFVYLFGGQSGTEPATNSMVSFLAADGYAVNDVRGSSAGNDEAVRNLLMPLRSGRVFPFDMYVMASTFGSVSGNHDLSAMVGLHRSVLQFRAPQLLSQILLCRSEEVRLNARGVSHRSSEVDAVDSLVRSQAATGCSGSVSSGVEVYFTQGSARVEGLKVAVTQQDLETLSYVLYSGVLPREYLEVLADDEEEEDEDGSAAVTSEKVQVKRSIAVLRELAATYNISSLTELCEAHAGGQRRIVEKAATRSTAVLRRELGELLDTGKGSTITVLFVDPHTKSQTTHALHPGVLASACPFFAELLRPLYFGGQQHAQVGPVAAKVTCGGPLISSTSKRSVLVGPLAIPKLAVMPILRFLYTQELVVPVEVAYVVMLGAHQLSLPLLQSYCETIVAREEVNYENCCSFYRMGRKYSAFLLSEMSLLTAVSGFSSVRYSIDFKNLSEEDRCSISDIAKELGSSDWLPPPAPTTEMKTQEEYAERWKQSAS